MKWISLVIAVMLLAALGAHSTRAHSGHAHRMQTDWFADSPGLTASVMPGNLKSDHAGQLQAASKGIRSQVSRLQLGPWTCLPCRGECETSCDTCMAVGIGCGACAASCCIGVTGMLTASLALRFEAAGNKLGHLTGAAMADHPTGPEPPPPKS